MGKGKKTADGKEPYKNRFQPAETDQTAETAAVLINCLVH
jgi:hypothetical protein